MEHFKRQRQNFCLQNIEFNSEKLFGLAKYPINVWNQLEMTTHDLKTQHHGQIGSLNALASRVNFFMTAGLPMLHSISTTQAGYSYPYSLIEGMPGQ